MRNNVMFIPACVLMAVEVIAITYLVLEWRKAKKEEKRMITDNDVNIQEVCFHNGEEHMREKVIAMLMEHKTWSDGVCHAHIAEIIRKVERL